MQLQLSFSALLAGFAFVLSLQVLDAAPIPKPRSSVRMVTLPLKRMEQVRNVHPLIVYVSIQSPRCMILILACAASPTTHQP